MVARKKDHDLQPSAAAQQPSYRAPYSARVGAIEHAAMIEIELLMPQTMKILITST